MKVLIFFIKKLTAVFKPCRLGFVFFLGCILLSGLTQSVSAQPLSHKLESFKAFSATFRQSVSAADGREIASSEGTLALRRPQDFMLHTTSPDELYLYTRADGVYYYDAFINQLTVLPLSSLADSPFALLLGKEQRAWQDYDIKEERQDEHYVLTPRLGVQVSGGGVGTLTRLELFFAGKHLERVEVFFADGNVNSYTFSAQRFEVNDADFACEVPTDAEVSDER